MVVTLKWIYKVKLDELGGILKNKARLVANGYLHEEGIDFEESFAPDGIFKWHSARRSLCQPTGRVCGLRQSEPCEFSKGTVNPILFIKRKGKDIILISQSPSGIFLNQSKYALESLKKYGMESSDPVDTPMVAKSKLDEDTRGKVVDPTHYHRMVGTFMYLTASRPDLTFVVCMCAQYQAKPTEKHLHAVKRIFKYLRGTINRGLWYPKDSFVALTVYADADHVDEITATDYGLGFNKIPMYCDNKSAITLYYNNVQHSRSKNINIRFHYIKEQVDNGVVELYFVNTEYQLANIFTKALCRQRIEFLINKLGMQSFLPKTLKQLEDEAEE
nr:hypothetical protein [Tanacetum cinerariifolium]